MIATYNIEKIDGVFWVIEKMTEHKVAYFSKYESARKYAKFLKAGGGFWGWTPGFFFSDSWALTD